MDILITLQYLFLQIQVTTAHAFSRLLLVQIGFYNNNLKTPPAGNIQFTTNIFQ